MPYSYAIQEIVTHEDDSSEINYLTVPQEVAETHYDGRWMLTNHAGREMTGWIPFTPNLEDKLAYGKGTPLVDASGQTLAARDLVMTTINKYADLKLCEVISFTAQKVHVRALDAGANTRVKYPSEIVKVDKSLFF